jgi:hypothetical protein
MTESTASEPIPAETLRTFAVAELTTIQNLLVYLDLDGLKSVLNRLHSPDLLRVCDKGPLAETRAVLLDTTCRALVALRWAPEQVLPGVRPHVPQRARHHRGQERRAPAWPRQR